MNIIIYQNYGIKELDVKKIFAVRDASFALAKGKPDKKKKESVTQTATVNISIKEKKQFFCLISLAHELKREKSL